MTTFADRRHSALEKRSAGKAREAEDKVLIVDD